MSKHILVTGGAGFIGSHLTRRLLSRGDRVTVLDDFNDFYDPARKRRNVAPLLERPDYRLVDSTGPDHSKTFIVECWLEGQRAGCGEGPSKKVAEQKAAADALSGLPDLPGVPEK